MFDELGSWYNPKQNVETDEDRQNENRDKFENLRDNHRAWYRSLENPYYV